MNRTILFAFFLCLVIIPGVARNINIVGKVVDEQNMPLIGALVYCGTENKRAITNDKGEFTLEKLDENVNILEISYVGYETTSATVIADNDNLTTVEVKMLPDDKLLSTVEVFGVRKKQPEKMDMLTRIPLRASEQIQSISIISDKMLTEQGVQTLSDAVRNAPGLRSFGTFGGTTESLTSRGFRGVPTLKNGVRVNSDFRGTGFISDMQGVETVQILRGSAAISQGLGGDIGSAAGAINIATKTPHFKNRGDVGLRIGSWATVRPTFDVQTVMGTDENVGIRLNGALERGDNYRVNVEKDRFYINPSVAWKPNKKSEIILEMDYLHDSRTPDQGTVNLAVDSINAIYKMPNDKFMGFKTDRSITDATSYTARYNRSLGNGYFFKAVYSGSDLSSQKFASLASVLKSSAKDGDYNRRSRKFSGSKRDDKNQLFQFDFVGKDIHTGKIRHTFQLGVDFRTNFTATQSTNSVTVDTIDVLKTIKNDLPSGITLKYGDVEEARSFSYGISAQDVITFNKYLKASLGARYSQANGVAANVASSINGGVFDPMAGIIVTPVENVNFFASYATTTSLRNATSLLEDGTPVGEAKEKQFEFGVKSEWFQDRLRFNLTFFNLLNDNLTYEILNNALQGTGRYLKVGELTRKGLEAELTGRLLPTLDVVMGYAYLDAQYQNSPSYVNGSAPMNTAKHTANGWVNYTIPTSALKNLSFGLGAYYVGAQALAEYTQREIAGHQIQPNTRPFLTDPYTTVNFQMGYALKNIQLRLFVNNVLNQIGYTAYYRGGYLNPTAPRNFALNVNYKFN